MKLVKIGEYEIYHINFPTQFDLTMTLLRPQEYHESPRFREKIFTFDEYVEWYIKKFGAFTYPSDWSGFNIPSRSINAVRDHFRPHSKREQSLFQLLDSYGLGCKEYCLIGTYGRSHKSVLRHEICHGLFECSPEYKKAVTKVISQYPVVRLRKSLIDAGYNRAVLVNEIQAYALTGYLIPETQEMKDLRRDLKAAVRNLAPEDNINGSC